MKKVTIFKSAVLALLACVGIAACDKNSDVVPTEPETYTVKLGWAGEILDVSYEPMTRAATDDLYGIQVYSKPNNNSTATSWEPYAYGLFDDPTNISIDLASGNKYKFVATMAKDGKNRIRRYDEDFYSHPFLAVLDNKFYYGTTEKMKNLNRGATWLNDGSPYERERPNIERFYGELSDYIPSEGNTNAKIDMKRTSFGAKFIAEGKLAVDGKLEIQIDEDPKMELALTEGDDQISDIFTFANVYEAWRESESEEYALYGYFETIDVSFKWIRPDGTELQIGTFPITFKRNTTTVVTIKMENDVIEGDQTGGVSFNIASSETGEMPVDENNSVTIIDGEMQ